MVPDGEDRLFGGSGNDCMFGGSGDDVFYGGAGNDVIWSWDYSGNGKPARDVVRCGDGRDEVLADRIDRLYGCEKVDRLGRR
jgi:Ca2+-binding RTX toxin-like protein